MASKKHDEAPAVFTPSAEPETTLDAGTAVRLGSFGSLEPFRAPKAVNFKRNLTPQLVAMAHEKDLLMRCDGEITEIDLPVKGRADVMKPTKVMPGTNMETGETFLLICNVMIVSAFTRAGGDLAGRYFGLKSQEMVADQRYRVIDVVEVELEF